jgi:hypothetical protein
VFSLGSVPVMTSYNSRGIGDGVFFVVCPKATMGAAVFSLRSVLWKCFLCGLFTGYITNQGHQPETKTGCHIFQIFGRKQKL